MAKHADTGALVCKCPSPGCSPPCSLTVRPVEFHGSWLWQWFPLKSWFQLYLTDGVICVCRCFQAVFIKENTHSHKGAHYQCDQSVKRWPVVETLWGNVHTHRGVKRLQTGPFRPLTTLYCIMLLLCLSPSIQWFVLINIYLTGTIVIMTFDSEYQLK